MINQFRKEVLKLKNASHVNKKVLDQFLFRINLGNLIRQQNQDDHFCSFFLPLDLKTKSVYLGHHIKAGDWIPPGGHIDPNEIPIETVKREFVEELQYKLKKEKVQLFDLTIKDLSDNPKHTCKLHYDFWYLVYLNKTDFIFDKSEFYQAKWLTIPAALKRMKLKNYADIIQNLLTFHLI